MTAEAFECTMMKIDAWSCENASVAKSCEITIEAGNQVVDALIKRKAIVLWHLLGPLFSSLTYVVDVSSDFLVYSLRIFIRNT